MKTKKGKTFKCRQCSKVYKSAGFLRRHEQYYCTADMDEDSRTERKKYFCGFCNGDYSSAKSYNLHYVKCLKIYDASQKTKQSSNSSKQYVCSICNKGFSRLGTYKCHLSCHENKEKKIIKSVIQACSKPKELVSSACTGITQPDTSTLPRIPRLSQRNRLRPDHSFCKPPEEELADEVPAQMRRLSEDEPVVKLTVTLNNNEVILTHPMPKIQNVWHVEKESAGLSMPQLEPQEPNPDSNNEHLMQQLMEDMRVTDEETDEEEPPQMSSSQQEEPLSDEDVTIVEMQADGVAGSQLETDRVQTSVENVHGGAQEDEVSSSRSDTVVLSEDEDIIIVEAPTSTLPTRVQVTTSTPTTNQTVSTINLLNMKPFVCTVCGRKFRTENTLQLHHKIHKKSSHHQKVSPSNYAYRRDPRCCPQRPPQSRNCPQGPRLSECLVCGFSSIDPNAVAKHKLLFHKRNFACQVCGRTFHTRFSRYCHMRSHSEGAARGKSCS